MKQRITATELKAMTMKELAAWVEFNACAINRTMVMSWGHEELFKGYHIRPEYTGYNAGRLIVKAFHFTSRTRKADAQSFAEWLHWAIFGEYPAEETEETAEQIEETENAPQAATQAPEQPTTTEQKEEDKTMSTTAPAIECLQAIRNELKTAATPATIRAALDAIRQHDPETELTEDDSARAIRGELQHIINGLGMDAYMEQARAHRAPQAATEQPTTEREALERINARQNAANLFTNITPADITAEVEAMNTEKKEEEKHMSTTANELQNYVNRIADDLRKLYEADPTDEEREAAEENGEACDLYSYFSDALDIEYTISSRGDYLGARIAVALGGPNIYIDTREGYVKGYWGTDRAECWIPSEICEEINSIMEEYYDMVRGA